MPDSEYVFCENGFAVPGCCGEKEDVDIKTTIAHSYTIIQLYIRMVMGKDDL